MTPRVSLVTGAASGIGRATSVLLAESGDIVCAVDRDRAGLETLVADIAATGGEAFAVIEDLEDPTAPQRVVAQCVARAGQLDVVALIAGVPQLGPVGGITLDEWDRVIGINLRAPFLLAQAALPELVRTHGSMVAVSSIAGIQGWPYASAYSASKGGLVTMMRSLAIEFGPSGVRINIICPGSVATGMSGAMRVVDFEYDESLRKRTGGLAGGPADPSEIASLIEFLASPKSSFVNGAVLRADGGAFA